MYHVELRQFPHNFCRFNLTERELHEIVIDGWARGEWIEFGERKWNPHQASLTVIEGPRLPVQQLAMGRGWRKAIRQGSDVTEQLLASARAVTSTPSGNAETATLSSEASAAQRQPGNYEGGGAASATGEDADTRLAADSLGIELLASLGAGPMAPAIAWRLARARYPERAASDCLRLAEQAIRSLIQARLVVVLVANEKGEHKPFESPEHVQRALLAIDGWTEAGAGAILLAKV
jgi:hypothetical protein